MVFTLNDILLILGSAIVGGLISWLVFRILLEYIKRVASHTKTTLDDKILTALELPVYLAVVVLAIHFGLDYTSFRNIDNRAVIFGIATILLITYSLLRLFDATIQWYVEEVQSKSKTIDNIIPTMRRIARIVIMALGGIMILRALGIEITPILAALGIGGLAIALAFQDTLSNFFAGLYITIDRPLKVGDYVELDGGVRGYVVSVGWRSTQIRTLANNLVIIPNSKLVQSVVTNFYLPTKDMAVVIPCSVAYKSDLEKVEKVTIETAREMQKKVKGALPDFDPFIRFHTFGDNGINFSIIMRVAEFVDQYLLIHEFIKELHKRYAKEGIEIPFPQRTVHFTRQRMTKTK